MRKTEVVEMPGQTAPVTVYRRAMSTGQREDLLCAAIDLAGDRTVQDLGERKFWTSPIISVPNNELRILGCLPTELAMGEDVTMRLNIQAPYKGKQGWHQDFVPAAVALYPEGEGTLDFNLSAATLREARDPDGYNAEIMSIPIEEGDIVVIGCGDMLFHRGHNTSSYIRHTIALHTQQFSGQFGD